VRPAHGAAGVLDAEPAEVATRGVELDVAGEREDARVGGDDARGAWACPCACVPVRQ
jgi:hypothetical protein